MRTSLHTKGYSLVEVLVAVAILLLALVGPMTIAAKSLQSSYYAREQATALFLAQEGIELVVAMRNDALIAAIQDRNLGQGWNWVNNGRLSACFGESGCNIALIGNSGSQSVLDSAQTRIVDCGSSSCQLTFDEFSARARYTLGSGEPTKYTRVITLESIDGNTGVLITSRVEWDATIFAGETLPVELTSAVYRIYD
jgi:prepilin-type N-terminal cleavage/methylation domain-containing protein